MKFVNMPNEIYILFQHEIKIFHDEYRSIQQLQQAEEQYNTQKYNDNKQRNKYNKQKNN